MEHTLKAWPEYYQAVRSGAKPFEIRKEDGRRFEVGDTLNLREWEPMSATYTGDRFRVLVTYVLRGGPWLPAGYVCMGVRPVDAAAVERVHKLFMQKLAAEYPDHPWLEKDEVAP